ncbi:MAG: hypothetical protein R3314_12570, partial [Longimicrobiales bacterium]|nr:hypothetical protein [Longimicrobiales bacterium]
MKTIRALILTGLAVASTACSVEPNDPELELAEGITMEELEERVAEFATAEIAFDETALVDWEKAVLAKLVEASDIMHRLFARQVSPQNPAWADRVANRGEDAAAEYFDIMLGPWDRQRENEPFLDVGPKPAGAGYYPPDLTREEWEAWLEANPEDRADFTSPFTVIRREGDALVA